MGKPKIHNQKSRYEALNIRLNKYMVLIQSVYDMLNTQVANMVSRLPYDGNKEFHFSDFPEVKASLNQLQYDYVQSMQSIIYRGTSDEWKNSNLMQDLLADKVLNFYSSKAGGVKHKVYYQTNSDALKAFQERKDKGMNLSQKVWNLSDDYKKELEYAVSTAIQKGTSAVQLSKKLSKYLVDFENLKKDYKDKYGSAVDCHDCEYRSIRLARSEINMAYRTAEQLRWRQMDFVLGYEIKLSKKHKKDSDICDILAGKYPKSFVWTGWHPNDLCYVVPILATEDEFCGNEPIRQIEDVPPAFKKWVGDNSERIYIANARNILPYWIKDNKKEVFSMLPPQRGKKMTEQDVEALHVKNFNRFNAEKYNNSAIHGFDLPSFDNLMEEIGDKYNIYWSGKKISFFENGNTVLSYKGLADDADFGDVYMSRSFIYDGYKRVVSHDLFKLPEELQGRGVAKQIFRGLFSQYENMGIDRVELTANIDVGGYAWAKYGFCAKSDEIRLLLKEQLRVGKLSTEEYNEAMSIIKKEGRKIRMNRLAQLPYGKKMLLGTQWNAFLDFKDLDQVRYLHDYIGIEK